MKINFEPILRGVSLLGRFIQSSRKNRRQLRTFLEWKAKLQELIKNKEAAQKQKKILIIRLDDIGDYLLFRNTLEFYKNSDRFRDYHITLLGNMSWKGLFDSFDSVTVDEAVWVNKKQYRNDEQYRNGIWEKLFLGGFETVVCPSRTRPLLLDDLCAIAANAKATIAVANTLESLEHEQISDKLYTSIFPRNDFIHEFEFNQLFAKWCSGSSMSVSKRPAIIPPKISTAIEKPYLLFCLGTTAKSRRWPVDKWIALMQQCRERFSLPVVLESGSIDSNLTAYIQSRINIDAVTGKTTLADVAGWMGRASVVFAHDSMAAHLSVCCNVPTIIIANGMHYHRFTAYEDFGMSNVRTVLPDAFTRWRKRNQNASVMLYTAVTRDVATISVDAVLEKLSFLSYTLLRR